ncbi:hypothetical protein CC80DRAFT_557358 [Byssothecium circinans]|uniref:Uncharacterized protein n=1 Tax=Byssothecium circinans TaxID=147558 RepID=A0A6A5UIF9_9PLEO|nr:hypothetical protein CC80DRAFT_557358 [Byssothecium circinans]
MYNTPNLSLNNRKESLQNTHGDCTSLKPERLVFCARKNYFNQLHQQHTDINNDGNENDIIITRHVTTPTRYQSTTIASHSIPPPHSPSHPSNIPLPTHPPHKNARQVLNHTMCHALLTTCTTCAWLLHITYPHCTHASTCNLEPQACPYRMKKVYRREGLCPWCMRRRESLSVLPGDVLDVGGDDGREEEEEEGDGGEDEDEDEDEGFVEETEIGN